MMSKWKSELHTQVNTASSNNELEFLKILNFLVDAFLFGVFLILLDPQ